MTVHYYTIFVVCFLEILLHKKYLMLYCIFIKYLFSQGSYNISFRCGHHIGHCERGPT